MKLFDSHCHLDDTAYRNDLDAVLDRARTAGVDKIMTIGVTRRTSRIGVGIAESRDGVYATVGIHPHDAKEGSEKSVDDLRRLAEHPKVKAWGEVGLDFNRMFSSREDQEKWLIRQLEVSETLDLPLVFHERDSNGRFVEILRERFRPGRKGVVHCFSGTRKELETYLRIGLSIGITGIVTVQGRGAPLRDLVPFIPLDRLLIETDGPYLVPVPQRNKFRCNEPAFVRSVLLKLADIRGETPEELARATYENACRVYSINCS